MQCLLRFITCLVTGAVLLGLGMGPSSTRADEPTPNDSVKPRPSVAPALSPQPEAEQKTPPTDEQTSKSDADEQPSETLTAPLTQHPESDENPLHRAAEAMRSAHERIAEQDTGEETREIQQTVVDELEKLIELAKQQRLRPPQQQNRPQQQQNQNQQQQQQQQAQQSQSDDAAQTGTGQPKGGQQPNEDPADSEQRAGTAEDRNIELAPRRALLNEVWGHLPDRLRQKLLNIEGEQYLPQYDTLIRRYFEALAEQNQSSTD